MKRLLVASLVAAFALTLATTDGSAQWAFLGAALTVPTQDFAEFPDEGGDGAKAGYLANGGVMFPVGDGGVSIGAGGFFGSNSHDLEGDKTNLYGANAMAGVSLGDPEASTRPFVYGGLGFLTHSYKSEDFPDDEGSWSGLSATGGAGVAFSAGESLGILVSGSYTTGFGDVSDTTFLSIGAAAQIPLGN